MKLIVPSEEFIQRAMDLKARYDEARNIWAATMRSVHPPPSCDACDHHGCCKTIPLALMFEAVVMLVRFQNRPGLVNRLIDQGNEMDLVLGDPAAEGSDARTAAWVERDEECVLRRKGQCFGYDVAPLSCRAYFVTTPMEHCCKDHQVAWWNSGPLKAQAMVEDMKFLRLCTGELPPMDWRPMGAMMGLAVRLANGEELNVVKK